MSGSVNKVILIGHLGRDPEVRQLQDGNKVVNLSLATSESWKDRDSGERRDRTEWHRVVIFNERLADVAERYLRKGAKVYLEGQLQTRKWTDTASGQEKYSTEVVLSKYRGELTMLDGKGENALGSAGGSFSGSSAGSLRDSGSDSYMGSFATGGGSGLSGSTQGGSTLGGSQLLDDEIPF